MAEDTYVEWHDRRGRVAKVLTKYIPTITNDDIIELLDAITGNVIDEIEEAELHKHD